VTEPRPLPPRPSTSRPAAPGSAAARGADRRAATPDDPRGAGSERSRVGRAGPQGWHQRNAGRVRWTTWIAIVLIAIRLIAPRPDGWRRWSDASTALLDVEAARTAALLYYQAASRTWPPPGRPGVAPSGMLPFLPGDVSYARPRYRLAWEYAADTLTGARVIGISVTGDDARLAQTMALRAPQGMPFIVSGRRFVALIGSAPGR